MKNDAFFCSCDLTRATSLIRDQLKIAHEMFDINRYGWIVLDEAVANEKTSLSELRTILGLSTSRMSAAVASLNNSACIIVKSSKDDRRKSVIEVSKRGSDVHRYVISVTGLFCPEEKAALQQLMQRVLRAQLSMTEFRILLILFEEQFLSLSEISDILHLPLSTINSCIERLKLNDEIEFFYVKDMPKNRYYYQISEAARIVIQGIISDELPKM